MGKFITLMGIDGHYYFNLLASNGKIILSSEAYATDFARDHCINTIQLNAFDESKFERKTTSAGKFYFLLKSAEGEIIAHSEMYESPASRDNGIEAVKNNARDAAIEMAV